MKFLCISIRWLDDRYHGQDGEGRPEWPPSPLRVFQAMLASAYRRAGEARSFLASFRWFQELGPPIIVAPPTQRGQPYIRFVPNNDSDRTFDRQNRLSAKGLHPTLLLADSPISYLWKMPAPLPRDCESHVQLLCDIARRIVVFGWGVDMAIATANIISADQAIALTGERWEPGASIKPRRLRIPGCRTLDALTDRHRQFVERLRLGYFTDLVPLDSSSFRVVGYRRTTDPPVRRWAAFRLRHPFEDRWAVFGQIRANRVAAMVRHATGMAATQQGRPGEWIDRYVHGHCRDEDESLPRFSYLPLPSLERRGELGTVLGSIRRMLVAELAESAESSLQWARQMLPGQFLIDEATRDRKALITPLTTGDWVLKNYTDPAESWATTTPVVLAGCDGKKFAKAEKLFAKSLAHAGYSVDALAELEFRDVSFWPGGDLASRFHRPNYLRERHWSVYHVRLRWKQPVAGPIALGAGRHCGLGIFAAMREH